MKEQLLLKNQLCFPLYAASKAVTRLYLPHLSPLGLTYTQYIVFLILFENDGITVKELGKTIRLDSGTLSPLLEKLEKQGYIEKRKTEDGRERRIYLTKKGKDMEEPLSEIPKKIGTCLHLTQEEAKALYTLSYRVLDNIEEGDTHE